MSLYLSSWFVCISSVTTHRADHQLKRGCVLPTLVKTPVVLSENVTVRIRPTSDNPNRIIFYSLSINCPKLNQSM